MCHYIIVYYLIKDAKYWIDLIFVQYINEEVNLCIF
jgi:hypothetical protein